MFRIIYAIIFTGISCIFTSEFAISDAIIHKFVALKGKRTNVRAGPGEDYKIIRVYDKTNMPLEILHRIDNWYMISDYQEKIGWIRVNLVASGQKKRKAIFQIDTKLCHTPVVDLQKCIGIARVDRGIVGTIRSCNKTWCSVILDKYYISGFAPRKNIWGITSDEVL